ncbi:MAG TPA: hypothetical protein VK157_12620 [Phycisphaerales bacterium]|nr:hypothetical protein [Phycisphaerales bacterium]
MGAVYVIKDESVRSEVAEIDLAGLPVKSVVPVRVRRVNESWVIVDYAFVSPDDELPESKRSVVRAHMQRLAPAGDGITMRSRETSQRIRLLPYTYRDAVGIASEHGLLGDEQDFVKSSITRDGAVSYVDVYGILYRCDRAPGAGTQVRFEFDRAMIGMYGQPANELILDVVAASS